MIASGRCDLTNASSCGLGRLQTRQPVGSSGRRSWRGILSTPETIHPRHVRCREMRLPRKPQAPSTNAIRRGTRSPSAQHALKYLNVPVDHSLDREAQLDVRPGSLPERLHAFRGAGQSQQCFREHPGVVRRNRDADIERSPVRRREHVPRARYVGSDAWQSCRHGFKKSVRHAFVL